METYDWKTAEPLVNRVVTTYTFHLLRTRRQRCKAP